MSRSRLKPLKRRTKTDTIIEIKSGIGLDQVHPEVGGIIPPTLINPYFSKSHFQIYLLKCLSIGTFGLIVIYDDNKFKSLRHIRKKAVGNNNRFNIPLHIF